MAAERWRVFLDTNVLIAGLISKTGASAAILDLGEAEEIIVVLSNQILIEADRVFQSKLPQLTENYRRFMRNLAPLLIEDPGLSDVREARRVIHWDDAAILAAAKKERLDYFVTLDKKDFNTPGVRAFFPHPIVTLAEFLQAFRRFWEQQT